MFIIFVSDVHNVSIYDMFNDRLSRTVDSRLNGITGKFPLLHRGSLCQHYNHKLVITCKLQTFKKSYKPKKTYLNLKF